MDHNELDKIFRVSGWYYDNGWLHDSTRWDCYVDDSYGRSDPFFVILSKDGNGRLLKLGKAEDTKEEIWAGPLSNEVEIDNLLTFVKSSM
jgi:hypothetical protein